MCIKEIKKLNLSLLLFIVMQTNMNTFKFTFSTRFFRFSYADVHTDFNFSCMNTSTHTILLHMIYFKFSSL